jgi:sortase family protein
MALKGRMSRTFLSVGFLALDLSLLVFFRFPSRSGGVYARQLLHTVTPQVHENVGANVLRSVALNNSLVFPVVQQPNGKPNYVSGNTGELTQFSSATEYGNIGLLAHNFLSGKTFFRLSVGDEVDIEYDDGTTESFVVSQIFRYQALDPKNPLSSFQSLTDSHEILSAQQMFERAYAGDRHVTFQTCIAKDGNASWGRLFVVAIPRARALTFAPWNMQNGLSGL